MKKIITVLVVAFSCVLTSCDKLEELGIIDPTKYFIEMELTFDEWELENATISTYTDFTFNPVSGENMRFMIMENYNYDGRTRFELSRDDIPIYCKDNQLKELGLGFSLFLRDIPLIEGVKYYLGDVDEINTSDGVVVPDEDSWTISGIRMWGDGIRTQRSTFGWMKFTRIEYVSKDHYTGYEIDLEFEFEVKDPETGEITLKVENGKIFDNPGRWTVNEI